MNPAHDSNDRNNGPTQSPSTSAWRAATSPITAKQGLICLGILAVIGVFYHPHAPLAVGTFFGFYAWFGLLACASLVVLAKMVFGSLLKRTEDYYGK